MHSKNGFRSLLTATFLVLAMGSGLISDARAGEGSDRELNTASGVKIALVKGAGEKSDPEDGRYLKVLIKVPRGISDLAEICIDNGSKAFQFVEVRSNDFLAWCGAFLNQMNGLPVVSPVNHPLASGPYRGKTNLFFTHEKRLKTVVER